MRKKNLELIRKIRFVVPSQAASISPPIGPILGQFGINIMDFCKQFNEISNYIDQDVLVLVILFLYRNKTFTFEIKTPSISFMVNEENYENISETDVPVFINFTSLYKILLIKKYMGSFSLDDKNIFKSLCGSIKSMHIKICNDIFTLK